MSHSPLRRMVGFIQLTTWILPFFFLPACSTPAFRIQSDFVPAESLRVAQVAAIAKREEAAEVYKGIIAAGVPDSELVDGSIVMARIYCCGGITDELSAERVNARMLFVPKGMDVTLGDVVEMKVGRPPKNGDGGLLNTVTRVVQKYKKEPEICWWDPKNDRLWLRVLYCEWMPKEGWIKQGGSSPAWFKPAAH